MFVQYALTRSANWGPVAFPNYDVHNTYIFLLQPKLYGVGTKVQRDGKKFLIFCLPAEPDDGDDEIIRAKTLDRDPAPHQYYPDDLYSLQPSNTTTTPRPSSSNSPHTEPAQHTRGIRATPARRALFNFFFICIPLLPVRAVVLHINASFCSLVGLGYWFLFNFTGPYIISLAASYN